MWLRTIKSYSLDKEMMRLLFVAPLFLLACDDDDIGFDTSQYVSRDEHEAVLSDLSLLQAQIEELQVMVGTLSSDLDMVEGTTQILQSDVDANTTAFDELSGDLSGLGRSVLQVLSKDQVFSVDPGGSGDFDDLNTAFEYLQGYAIPYGVQVTLQLTAGTHAYGAALRLQHRDGERIAIIGDAKKPESVVLDFGYHDGIVIDGGYGLGLLQGVTIQSDNSDNIDGVIVKNGGRLTVSDVIVTGFGSPKSSSSGTGFKILTNGVLIQEGTSIVSTNNHDGFRSYHGGVAVVSSGAQSYGNNTGFVSSYGGVMSTRNTDSSDNYIGYYTAQGGYMDANGAVSTGDSTGFYVRVGSTMNANDSTAVAGNDGYEALEGSVLYARDTLCDSLANRCVQASSHSTVYLDGVTTSDVAGYEYKVDTSAVIIAGDDLSGSNANISLSSVDTTDAVIHHVP